MVKPADLAKNVFTVAFATTRTAEAMNKWQQWNQEANDLETTIPELIMEPIGRPGGLKEGEDYLLKRGEKGWMKLEWLKIQNGKIVTDQSLKKVPKTYIANIDKSVVEGLYVIKEKFKITDDEMLMYLAATYLTTDKTPKPIIEATGIPTFTGKCDKVFSSTLNSLKSTTKTSFFGDDDTWGSYMLRYTADAAQVFSDIGYIPPTVQVLLLMYKIVTLRCTLGDILKKIQQSSDKSISGSQFIIVKRALSYLKTTIDTLFTLAYDNQDLVEIKNHIENVYKPVSTEVSENTVNSYFNILDSNIVTKVQSHPTVMDSAWWDLLFPKEVDEYQNVMQSLRTSQFDWFVENTRYISSGVFMGYALVIGTLMGGIVFQLWYKLRKRVVLNRYPQRKQLVERAYKLFKFRNSLKTFTLLKATLVKRPLLKNELNSIYSKIKEDEQLLKMSMLYTKTDLPIQSRHYALGGAVYLFLIHRILIWGKRLYNWANIPGKDATYEGVRNNLLMVGGVVGANLFGDKMLSAGKIIMPLLFIILVPAALSLLPVLNPMASISFLASIFSFIEYAFKDLFALLLGGRDVENAENVAYKLGEIRKYAQSKAEYIRLKRENVVDEYYRRTRDLKDKGYQVEDDIQTFSYAPDDEDTVKQSSVIRKKILEETPRMSALNRRVNQFSKSASWAERSDRRRVKKSRPYQSQSARRA